MHRRRLLWQLYPSYLLITLVALVTVGWYALSSLRHFYYDKVAADLDVRAQLLEHQLARKLGHVPPEELDRLSKSLGERISTRITIIDMSGVVLGDTAAAPAEMANHGERPEVIDALRSGRGHSVRYSSTAQRTTMYLAVPLEEDGVVQGVLRVSLPVTDIDEALWSVRYRILLAGAGTALAAAALSWVLTRRFSRPLEEMQRGAERFASGELDYRLPVAGSEETGRLAEAMNDMASQLSDRIRSLAEQHSEQEALLSSMVEGVIAVDPRGTIITLNRSARELFKLDPRECQGKPLRDVIHNPSLQSFLAQTLSSRSVTEGEIVLGSRHDRLLQLHGTTLRNGQGQELGALVVANDVTRLRRLEAVRSDFVANVSHELKTPVTSIKGFVETLRDGALADREAANRFLEIIAKQADRLQTIIEDLLSLSRIEQDTKKGQIEFKPCELKPVLRAAIQECEPKARERRMNVELNCEEHVAARINPRLLEEALVNLIDNAIKYSGPDSTIRVEARRQNSGVTVRVADEGHGIAQKHVPRLFERFYRVDKARSRKLGGTGLGLAIVKHIVQAHGGSISVKSQPGVGSAFTLHLRDG